MDTLIFTTPCCQSDIKYEDALKWCEWYVESGAPELRQGIIEWSYCRCPYCGGAYFLGYGHRNIKYGLFGTESTLELITTNVIHWKPEIQKINDKIIIDVDGVQYAIPLIKKP